MKTIHVNLDKRSYDILIAPGLLERIAAVFQAYRVRKRIFLISNAKVFPLFGEDLLRRLSKGSFQVTEILVPDGEQSKQLETVENIYTDLIAQRADRYSTLAALGGGVTGDIAGFAAATFLRGISYIQIPTTLLAQVDSSVGGKTGVNHRLGKNLIGAFYQPHLVYIDINTLTSLPQREFQSGLYEVVKYGLIYDFEFFEYFESHLEQILQRVPHVLENVVSRCCEVKAEITSLDETEQDLRLILNFGHTFGHALEAAGDFQGLTHGEAVGYGMLAAIRLSNRRGHLSAEVCDRLSKCIWSIGGLPPIDHVSIEQIFEAMKHDKKRHQDRNQFVLLKDIGKTVVHDDLDKQALTETWEQVKLKSQGVFKNRQKSDHF